MRLSTLRMSLLALAVMLAAGFLFRPCHAGMSPLDALSLSVGAQGRWLDTPTLDAQPDFEAAGNAALTLTPHVAVTGGIAVGLGGSYLREQVDARITASDVLDPSFSVWLGAGYYWSEEFDDGLGGWASKAGMGWRPAADLPIVLGLTAAATPADGRTSISFAAVWAFKVTRGTP